MARWGMVIDLAKCTACQTCVLACQAENNIPVATPGQSDQGRAIQWIRILPLPEGENAHARLRLLPVPCLHCDEPPCIKVCPVDATNITPEGTVRQIFARCIGCRYCTTACPYTVRKFNWSEPRWEEPWEEMLNPDVSIRPKGVVEKCTLCHHRLQLAREQSQAERRTIREGDYVPACVESCPTEAMVFGDLDDPESRVTQLTRSARAFRLLEELGTRPKILYLSEGEWSGKRA
jgi:Fe-S-cluster-containing dehydrogenase component